MTRCLKAICWMSAVLLAASAAPAQADSTKEPQADQPKMVQRVFPVADLIMPIEDSPLQQFVSAQRNEPGPTASKSMTTESALIHLITQAIAPQTWDDCGGPGTIGYLPLGMALVVTQTPDLLEQVQELLDALRRLQDVEVVLEVRCIGISAEMAETLDRRYGIDCKKCARSDDPAEEPQMTLLNEREVLMFMAILQGDPRTNIMQAPKLTLWNGQTGTVEMIDYQWFVTNVQIVQNGGSTVFVPQQTPFRLGLDMTAQAVIADDRKSVRVNVKLEKTELASDQVRLLPVTSYITPVRDDGSEGTPVPFKQYVQEFPKVNAWKVERTMNIGENGSALLSGWKVEHGRHDPQPCLDTVRAAVHVLADPPLFPFLRFRDLKDLVLYFLAPSMAQAIPDEEGVVSALQRIPYLEQLLQESPERTETEHLLLMVTPRIVIHSDEECAALAIPVVPLANPDSIKHQQVADLMAQFKSFLKDGQYKEAEHCAVAAHELDPDNPATDAAVITARILVHQSNGAVKHQETAAADSQPPEDAVDRLVAKKDKALAQLLTRYDEACCAGRLAEAKKLANQALALNPTCFRRVGPDRSP